MFLSRSADGWWRFGSGHRWRCAPPRYLCEIDDPGSAPNYATLPQTVSAVRRIKSFYQGRVRLGILDEMGTGLDILVANSLAESLGTVPSPLSTSELRDVFSRATGTDIGARLDEVVRHVAMRAKYLERREPGYSSPVATPGRVSVGSHHVLLSTALALDTGPPPNSEQEREGRIVDLTCRLPAESLYAAALAVRYFERSYSKHQNQPPLLAATYNAGSPRLDPSNTWNLKQYGQHVDRWVRFFNTSRSV